MLDFPYGTANYAASPSTIGPAGALIQQKEYPQTAGQEVLNLLSQYVPGASYAEALANFQRFPSKAPKAVREMLSAFGAYTKNKTKPKQHQVEF